MKKKILSLFLAVSLAVMLTGCGGSGDGSTPADGNDAAGTGESNAPDEGNSPADDKNDTSVNTNTAMGRYVEEETELADIGGDIKGMYQLTDGTLVIASGVSGFWRSADKGVTWENETPDWYRDLMEEGVWISDLVVLPDGTAAVILPDHDSESDADGGNESKSESESNGDSESESDGESDGDSESESNSGGDSESESDGDGDSDADSSVSDSNALDYCQKLVLVSLDGTQTPVELPKTSMIGGKLKAYPRNVWVTGGGRLFTGLLGGEICEVFADGSSEELAKPEANVGQLCVQGNLMYLDGRSYTGEGYEVFIYDMEQKKYVEDEALNDFMAENYGDRGYNGSDYGDVYFFPGEDGALYIAGEKGLHRHVAGGNMTEQVIDGSLSMLSNPNYKISDMFCQENDTFLALFINGKLIRFSYDETVPAVPENVLNIYSLEENDTVRLAISVYQASQHDVFVNYEVGMTGDGSVTREDALKKMNTEIMAGTGPDLIVMDGLPFSSYVEKGLLLDLTDYFAQYSAEEPLFDNVIDALKADGKAYVAPGYIYVPMIAGNKKYVENMTDMSSIADGIEAARRDNPGIDILRIGTGKGIIKRFSAVSEPLWQKEDGALDRAVLEEYLTACKRIYDAQMEGLPADTIQYLDDLNVRWETIEGRTADTSEWGIFMETMDYIGKEVIMPVGWLTYPYGYSEIISLEKVKGFEDTMYRQMEGQCSHTFMPMTMLGISAASAQTEAAKDFMDAFLSAEVQSQTGYFSVNRQAFDESLVLDYDVEDDGSFSGLATMDEDGNMLELNLFWPDDEQTAELRSMFESLDTAYICDEVIADAVLTQGGYYVEGEKSLDEALDAIEKQVALYMAE